MSDTPAIPGFDDAEGRHWNLRITAGRSIEILETCGIDLSLKKIRKVYEALEDPKVFVQFLWILIEKQAKALELTPDDFAESLDGDAVEAASEAINEAIVNFIPG